MLILKKNWFLVFIYTNLNFDLNINSYENQRGIVQQVIFYNPEKEDRSLFKM